MTRFTLWGLAQFDPHLFDKVLLPEGLDKELCINNIMNKSGDLYLYYQVPARAKLQIEDWFSMHYLGFKRMIEALLKEYNPIENTDKYEDESTTLDVNRTNQASGSDTAQASGTDSVASSGSDSTDREAYNVRTGEVSAFDSSDYEPHDKTTDDIDEDETITYGRTDTSNYGRKDTNTYGRKDDYKSNDLTHRVLHTHGNIGVTTNQQMVRDELELRVYNIYDVISEMFENDILIQIY